MKPGALAFFTYKKQAAQHILFLETIFPGLATNQTLEGSGHIDLKKKILYKILG
jgi:hypothetical protein